MYPTTPGEGLGSHNKVTFWPRAANGQRSSVRARMATQFALNFLFCVQTIAVPCFAGDMPNGGFQFISQHCAGSRGIERFSRWNASFGAMGNSPKCLCLRHDGYVLWESLCQRREHSQLCEILEALSPCQASGEIVPSVFLRKGVWLKLRQSLAGESWAFVKAPSR